MTRTFLTKTIWLLAILCSFQPVHSSAIDLGRFNFIQAGQKSVEIPFHIFNNQVILPVKVNGNSIPLNFVLDSGTSQAILFDRQLGKDLGVVLDRKIEFAGAGKSRKVVAYRTIGVDLELPGVAGDMMGMVVLHQDYMQMRRFDIHGVLGYQLFVRFAVSLDYQRNILTLSEPNHYDISGYHQFELSVESSKSFVQTDVMLTNNQLVSSKLMLDTGAAYGLSLITNSHPSFKPPKHAMKVRLASGLSGEIHGYNGVTQLRFSPQLSPPVKTMYVKAEDYAKKDTYINNKMGSIGGEFLRNYLVIIDYINYKLYLKPIDPAYLTQNNSH